MDEFANLRSITARKMKVQLEWEDEIRRMNRAGWSTRTLADPAGVSHMKIWELTRND